MKNKQNSLLSVSGLFFGITVVLVAILVLGNSNPIGNQAVITQYTIQGEPTESVLLTVPYVKNISQKTPVSIWADLNNDNNFTEDELLIENIPTSIHKNWSNGYYIPINDEISEETLFLVQAGSKRKKINATFNIEEIDTLMGLETVTNPQEAMKGFGLTETTYANNSQIVEIATENVPDLNQRPYECAPTAAANSLIDLVNKNGGEDLIAGDPMDFIENLKRHMNWTPENGVLPDDFVAGKNRWAAAAGVPIRTEKVGDANGLTTLDAIKDALQKGKAVELRVALADADAKFLTGHMVTVVGIQQGEGQTYLDINDPFTKNSGTETVEIRQNRISNYGPWNGLTILSWAFTQTWTDHPTGELLDPMSDLEIQGIREFAGEEVSIKVIKYNNNHLPVSQIFIGNEHPPHAEGEGCPKQHWHATKPVTSVEGNIFTDPNSGGCGFGILENNPSFDYKLPKIN